MVLVCCEKVPTHNIGVGALGMQHGVCACNTGSLADCERHGGGLFDPSGASGPGLALVNSLYKCIKLGRLIGGYEHLTSHHDRVVTDFASLQYLD